ncbi:hypothetical protein AcV7_001775 [Taiwanofungus camphoratus]|nr:hypothetical protein AcV7_001775 [Antrodia cinnamomea]
MPPRPNKRRHRSPSIVFVRMQRTAPPPFDSPDADLILQTHLDTRFLVSKSIIMAGSDYFRRLLSSYPLSSSASPTIIDNMPESGATIETILRLTYPVPEPILCDLDDVCDAYEAAKKYQMSKAQYSLRRMFSASRFMDVEPVRVYAIARRFGLEDVAENAAKHVLKSPPVWPNYEEFNDISAREYHALIKLHRKRGSAAAACLDDATKA